MADFRAERMPTPEGEGNAKDAYETAFETYYKVNKAVNQKVFGVFPEMRTWFRQQTNARIFDLFGFWLMWRALGGFENMQKYLGVSRSGMFRRIAMFRGIFGEHPDVYEFPGITIDPAEFATGLSERLKQQQKD